jgi:hypothetical protein
VAEKLQSKSRDRRLERKADKLLDDVYVRMIEGMLWN